MPDLSLLTDVHSLRRRVTQFAVRTALDYSSLLSPWRTYVLGRSLGRVSSMLPPLAGRLRSNWRRAGIEHTPERESRFFRMLGYWFTTTMGTYHRGFDRSGFADYVRFDDSVRHLDQAMARGRGVVLASAHMFCHEFVAARIHRRHPVAALVRDSKNPVRDAIKRRWYEATGLEIVKRSRDSTMMFDVMDYVRVLQDSKILAITPDLPTPAGQGVPVQVFGRNVTFHPGMAALAMWSGAPLVFCWPHHEFSRSGPNLPDVCFDEPIDVPLSRDRAGVFARIMNLWAGRLEAHLRRSPEYWMFWLDKRWSEIWRRPA